tara:strand:+ start:2187 stop:2588 length:402 start_codon:yes stop_codon:yes gene_type:complete
MATTKRTFPNDYFSWYNDDRRIAIVAIDTEASSTEQTREKYDTYQDADVTNGLRITYRAKYEAISTNTLGNNMSTFGVDTGLQQCIICYMKARLLEDQGNLQQAQYYRQMYEKMLKQYPTRKSGIRQLSVPHL